MIDLHLRSLGLSDKQIVVLLCLVEHGTLPVGDIGQHTRLPRSTVYSTLDELEKLSLVAAKSDVGSKAYTIAPGASFVTLVERQKSEVLLREKAAQQLAHLLDAAAATSQEAIPKIKFVSGKAEIFKWLFERRAAWRESMHLYDATWWGYQDDMFVAQYRDWFDDTWKTTPENENVRLLSNESELEATLRGVHHGREIRQLDSIEFFTSTIWVCGEYVIMITTRARPHYAFELRDGIFASNLRGVFSMMWKTKELEKLSN